MVNLRVCGIFGLPYQNLSIHHVLEEAFGSSLLENRALFGELPLVSSFSTNTPKTPYSLRDVPLEPDGF